MRDIVLHGELAARYGRRFRFRADTVTDALWLFQANFPDFFEVLRSGRYHVIRRFEGGWEALTEERLTMDLGACSLHLVPALSGSSNKKPIVSVILGVALLGAAIVLAGPAGLAGTAFTAFGSAVTYGNLAFFGGMLALGGISQLISGTPAVKDYSAREDRPQSHIFNGGAASVEQGGPVPIVVGKFAVTPTTVSAGIVSERLAAEIAPGTNRNTLSLLAGGIFSIQSTAKVTITAYGHSSTRGFVSPVGTVSVKKGESITVKYKLAGLELFRINGNTATPCTTPDANGHCTWTFNNIQTNYEVEFYYDYV